jgi:hypothetical protein
MWQVYTRPNSASDFFSSKLAKASKLAKTGTLRALGGQDLSHKNFECGGLELWARLKPSKRKIQIWLFRDQWTRENPIFSPVA